MSTLTLSPSIKFSCRYCPNKLTTPQILGGYQNAHKQVRKDEKRHKSDAYHDMQHYSILSSLDHFKYPQSYSTYQHHHMSLYDGSSVNPIYLTVPIQDGHLHRLRTYMAIKSPPGQE